MTVPRFWREIPQRYNLIANKCKKCGWVNFPPRSVCKKCFEREFERFDLSGEGQIITYTVIRVAPPGYEDLVPYVVAIIALKEGPRITAQIVDCDPSEVEIKKKVNVCFRKICEDGKAGAISYGYKFRLVDQPKNNQNLSSRVSGFCKLPISERIDFVKQSANLSDEETRILNSQLDNETAEKMIENVIGTYSLPIGLAVNFLINDKDYIIPMVLEEPSVVAAASNAAKIARECCGFKTSADEPIMIGQIHITGASDTQKILEMKSELLELANSKDPKLVEHGGGAKDLDVKKFDNFIRVHLYVDCRDAMGANAVNTMVEAIAPKITEAIGGKAVLKIISNLADKRLARSECVFKKEVIGEETINLILQAYECALADPYRAATHNKGIMNAISAICIATGNDYRAVEAGAHSFANQKPLTKYEKTQEGDLKASIELPLAVATIGGSTKHPQAQVNLKILKVQSAQELAQVMAAAGLAQNFAALKAITTEGIQKGHMNLHDRKF